MDLPEDAHAHLTTTPATAASAATDATTERPKGARLAEKLDRMLDALEAAKPFARSTFQTDVFHFAEALFASDGGLRTLADRAARFEKAGVFAGGPWEDPSKLRPQLVAGGLRSHGVYPVVEILSELRMLAIATGRAQSDHITTEDARGFLEEVMALNLGYLFPGDTEQERIEAGPHRETANRLFGLLAEELGMGFLRDEVVREIDQVVAQRPIVTTRIRRMIEMAERIPESSSSGSSSTTERLQALVAAVHGPTPLSREHVDPGAYRTALRGADPATLEAEARAFVASMHETGLVAPQHAVLLRFAQRHMPEVVPDALALNDAGRAELSANEELAHRLIRAGVVPATAQCIVGLARILERGLLSQQAVAASLQRLVDLDLQPELRRLLLSGRERHDGVSANTLLLSGAISVIGQPLGVGQGNNPTCQAARGISLWAQHAPAYMLELTISAARDDVVEMWFEGELLKSNDAAVAPRHLDLDLDPVSMALVPHLDRLYAAMMRRVSFRAEDGHKWVNPALYGRWVATGFASVFRDVAQTTVADHEDFVRRFFATHHPAYNDGLPLTYPNPVGLCITNSHGDYLGPHAVSLQRVAEDPSGELRAYFFNPNNEGRQDWGHGVRPSISDHGEHAGESSLPFRDFVSRLYAFHYNPYEEGDAYAVPVDTVASIERAAKETWGRSFTWID